MSFLLTSQQMTHSTTDQESRFTAGYLKHFQSHKVSLKVQSAQKQSSESFSHHDSYHVLGTGSIPDSQHFPIELPQLPYRHQSTLILRTGIQYDPQQHISGT